MNQKELQKRIDKPDHTPEDMRKIAEAYLRGDVLRDLVAAEGWLMKAIESEDGKESLVAMILLAKEILKKEHAISEADQADMEKSFAEGTEEEQEKLLYVMRAIRDFYEQCNGNSL